jgi:regulator of nucleoside diphosphate kinase
MRNICITEVDLERLRELVGVARNYRELDQAGLKALETELDRASIVSAETVPRDVITMHSRVRIRNLDTGEEIIFTLVYPREANLEKGRISIMTPLGTALLGYRAGDILDWKVPDGVRRLEVVEVEYQPEAAGHFHL